MQRVFELIGLSFLPSSVVTQCCHEISVWWLQRVLTAEYVDGCKINDVAAIQSLGLTLTDVCYVMCLLHILCL